MPLTSAPKATPAKMEPDEKAQDLVAVLTLDVDGDCYPDVILWSEKDGLQLRDVLAEIASLDDTPAAC